MSTVFIISVNYNSKESLLGLFDSLVNLETANLSIHGLVLDVSGELDWDFTPSNCNLIKIPENRGYAYAVNIGLKMAQVRGADYVWILNPDVMLEPTSLSSLIELSRANSNAIIGSAVYSGQEGESRKQIWGLGGYVSEVGEVSMGDRIPGGLSGSEGRSFFECDYVPGCSMFLPTTLLEVTGYLPEEYFLYFEETEWCLRAKEKGVKMLISVESEIWHRVYPGKLEEAYRVYFYNRSRRMFLWRNRRFFKSGSGVIVKSIKEFPSVTWALSQSPAENRKTFLAHFYALIDFFVISFLGRGVSKISELSRKRLGIFREGEQPQRRKER